MKKCNKCGANVDNEDAFCVHCGNRFIEDNICQAQYVPNNKNVYLQKKNTFKFEGWYIPTILSVILLIISELVVRTTAFLTLFIISLPWLVYGIITFIIYYFKRAKQRKEDVKNGIKRPRNVIFTIFCWLGWLIAFIIYAIATGGDVGNAKMVIPLLAVSVIPAYFIMHIYFAPYLIANSRGHVNETPIFILNILAGWTVPCWLIALVWAFTDSTLIDKKKRNQTALCICHEEMLAVIFDLYEKGAITQAEFEEWKKLVLSDK